MMEAEGYKVEYITPRGLGATDYTKKPYDKLTIASEVLNEINKKNINDFIVIGHDWGGTIGYLITQEAVGRCKALIVEEEILPGINVDIPEPGSQYYPKWHGPFNRSVGLGESLIPGNERTYYGNFLEESSGKEKMSKECIEKYLNAYLNETQLNSTLGYYRSTEVDKNFINQKSKIKTDLPILAIGGLFGMGGAVGKGMECIGNNVTTHVLQNSGHYPAEQEPKKFFQFTNAFLRSVLNDFEFTKKNIRS